MLPRAFETVTDAFMQGLEDGINTMDVILSSKYRLRDCDSLNWELCELRDVTKKDGVNVTEWCRTGHYFQNVHSALEWAVLNEMHGDPEAVDIPGYIDKIVKLHNEFKSFIIENSIKPKNEK